MPSPRLPRPRGLLSSAVVDALQQPADGRVSLPAVDGTDPYSPDLQLALYTLYELHYRSFESVDDEWEWDPDLLRFRRELERIFLDYVRSEVEPGSDVVAEMDALSVEPIDGNGPSFYLKKYGTWPQMQEYFIHRSIYHLKEADPHAWAIPRLSGQAKASFVAVEYDEYGAGRGDHVHQQLFADLLDAAALDSTYLGYLDDVPAETLATVNLMSLFGLHRSMRGATVGHFAATEITSSPGSRRLVQALHRMQAPEACVRFYTEHVEADAVHEQVMRHDVVGDLIAQEPKLQADVVFGMRAADFVEGKLGTLLVDNWQEDRTALKSAG